MEVRGNVSVNALFFSTVHSSPLLLFLPQTIILDKAQSGSVSDLFLQLEISLLRVVLESRLETQEYYGPLGT